MLLYLQNQAIIHFGLPDTSFGSPISTLMHEALLAGVIA